VIGVRVSASFQPERSTNSSEHTIRMGSLAAPKTPGHDDRAAVCVSAGSTAVTVAPSASAVANGGELLGQATAEGRHECEKA
jgi:hypothetical protein